MNSIGVCLRFNHCFRILRNLSQQNSKTVANICETLPKLSFYYPKYESPFTVSINSNYTQWMDKYCIEWALNNCGQMNRFDKYTKKIEKSDCGLFAALTYPSANWHRCEKLIKWSLIFFICDDYHDIVVDPLGHELRVEPFWDHMIEALDSLLEENYNSDNNWPQFVRAVQQILREIYFDLTPNQRKRSLNSIKRYILGNIQEKQWIHDLPDWDDYWSARLGSVGGHMALQMIEYAKNIELNDNQWNHKLIQELNRAVTEEIILINDYYTFRKEVNENNGNFDRMKHPFALLVYKHGMTLQKAVNQINHLIKVKDKQILKQIENIENIDNIEDSIHLKCDNISYYLNGVKEFLGGYWMHAISARRYHGLHFKGLLPTEGLFVYDPNQTIIKSSEQSLQISLNAKQF